MEQAQRSAASAVRRVVAGAALPAALAEATQRARERALVHELAYGTLRFLGQLRALVRDRLGALPTSNDYVLVVRNGLPEASEANGHDWLADRVDEVLGKAVA